MNQLDRPRPTNAASTPYRCRPLRRAADEGRSWMLLGAKSARDGLRAFLASDHGGGVRARKGQDNATRVDSTLLVADDHVKTEATDRASRQVLGRATASVARTPERVMC